MGHKIRAACLDCGTTFAVDKGGGFQFHLLRCDKCGKTKSIGFDRLGELHIRYLKDLPGPWCVATIEHDNQLRQKTDLEPIREDDYRRAVEQTAGKCKCGGHYIFDAPPRCPKCGSTRIEEGEIGTMCD